MLHTIIHQNSYQDSINLMLLTTSISKIKEVKKVQVMMGTDANKDIFAGAGLLTDEAKQAKPSDMMIVMDVDDKKAVDMVLKAIDTFLDDLSVKKKTTAVANATTWSQALAGLPDANIALISVPGIYAAEEIENALDNGLHAFVFSDNVALKDEVRLKQKAHEKGLLVMGPDCGTGIIGNVPLAFTNVVRSGNIGVVGASGTGIQEVTSLVDHYGAGVQNAIGTGGRDLSEAVGGITMKDAILGLNQQDAVDVLVVISKPPALKVRDDVVALLHSLTKPVVAVFIGEKPEYQRVGNIHFAYTLEEAAHIAASIAMGKKSHTYELAADNKVEQVLENKTVKGLYSGGTLAYEAGMLISEALGFHDHPKEAGYILKSKGFDIIDLGDDIYTQGHPHPMIAPDTRIEKIREFAADKNTGVILLDVVLGYGSNDDMAACLAPAIKESIEKAKKEGRLLKFIATVVGTQKDPQNYDQSVATLKQAGVVVEQSNTKAVMLALAYMGKTVKVKAKDGIEYTGKNVTLAVPSKAILSLLAAPPKVVNIGVSSFANSIKENKGSCIQFDWKPMAGGNLKLIKLIRKIRGMEKVQQKNTEVIERIKNSAPFLIDVVEARSVIPELKNKTLLHSGPPMTYNDMTSPMQGSCVGAILFEGWAKTEDEARKMLDGGEITFVPCHHVQAVGPMGGITSGSMPVFVVENSSGGNRSYCTLNEGIGKVLRFGAYSEEVINRLTWIKNVLGPVIGQALKLTEHGLNVNVLIAKGITMGDEFHQRNIAASLLFLKEMAPLIVQLKIDEKTKKDVIQFLADTDQFFLNVMMATGKSIVDYARQIKEGTIVTTMTRNGHNFGVRISGMGDQWFTAPVNTPEGLFFTGFSQEDANPDMGDSSITETVGVGAMAMIAAPGVTRFVGAGGFDDALKISNLMAEIGVTHNSNFTIPTWDFQGTILGIDILKVVETGIEPYINTGIAHKKAGVGQIGAGTVRAPLACFEQALLAYGKMLGIDLDD